MRCLKGDCNRAFISLNFIIGVLGVFIAELLSIYKVVGINTSVYSTYSLALRSLPYMMSMTFCSLPYAQSLCEDMEHRVIEQFILRKDFALYVRSKIVVIILSTIVTMMLGTLFFVFIVHTQIIWVSELDYLKDDFLAEFFITRKLPILYFATHALFMGIMAAILSLISTYASLFWRNKLWILSMPLVVSLLLIYCSTKFFPNTPQLNFGIMFNPSYNLWNNKIQSVILPILIGGILLTIIDRLIFIKIRRYFNV